MTLARIVESARARPAAEARGEMVAAGVPMCMFDICLASAFGLTRAAVGRFRPIDAMAVECELGQRIKSETCVRNSPNEQTSQSSYNAHH